MTAVCTLQNELQIQKNVGDIHVRSCRPGPCIELNQKRCSTNSNTGITRCTQCCSTPRCNKFLLANSAPYRAPQLGLLTGALFVLLAVGAAF